MSLRYTVLRFAPSLALLGCPGDDTVDDGGGTASTDGSGSSSGVATMALTTTGITASETGGGTGASSTGPDPDSTDDTGDTGSSGDTGDTGTTDDTSDTGTTGETGTSGDTGSSGATSTTGSSSSSSTGEPAVPEIAVTVEATPVDVGDTFDIGETVDVGLAGTPITVTIDNVGTADLTIGGVSLSDGDTGHFTLDTSMLAGTVMAGSSTTFTASFEPVNGGIKAVTVSIDNDDADENPFDFSLGAHTTPHVYRNVMPAAQPSGRFNAAMVDLTDGRLLLFGGRDATGTWLADTWVYAVETNTWTELMPSTPPSARDAAAMAYVDGDTVILFGGNSGFGGTTPTDDTWAFDTVSEEWSPLTPMGTPGVRFQHQMVYVGSDTIVMHGGRTSPGAELATTWAYDVAANTWTDLMPVMAGPARSAFAMDYDGTGTITLFGGFESFAPFDQTWSYDVAGNTWTLGVPTTTPGARAVLQGAYYDSGEFIVHSGKLDSCCIDPTQGTFSYDSTSGDWSDLAPPSEFSARFNYAMAQIAGTNKAIFFGGLTQNTGVGTALQETWEFVGAVP